MKKLSILFFVLSLNAFSQGTPPVIEVDPNSGAFLGEIPFDETFILKIKKETKPEEIYFLTDNKEQGFSDMLYKQISKSGTVSPEKIYPEDFWHKKIDGEGYLFIKFGDISFSKDHSQRANNYLKPSENLSLIILESNEKTKALSYTIFDFLVQGENNKAWLMYEKFTEERNPYDTSFKWVEFENSDTLQSKFQEIRPYSDSIKIANKAIAAAIKEKVPSNDSTVLRNLLGYLCEEDCFWGDSASVSRLKCTLEGLHQKDSTHLAGVLTGMFKLGNCTDMMKALDWKTQIKNIEYSQASLHILMQYYRHYQVIQNLSPGGSSMSSVKKIKSLLEKNKAQLQNIAGYSEKITNHLKPFFTTISTINGSNTISYQERNSLTIQPDFGAVAYGWSGYNSGVAPFVGFQINFCKMNRDIPFRKYPNKTLLHRLSFSFGWTLTKIAKAGKSEDFLTNGSALTGLGIKLFSHAVKLNVGSLWYYQLDPNPVITSRNLSVLPYAGISIDLQFEGLFNGVKSLIPNNR